MADPDKTTPEAVPGAIPVVIANPEPIPVTGELTASYSAPPAHADNPASAQASTTSEQDRQTAGQRQINVIWETTQKNIALSVIWAALFVAAVLAISGGIVGKADLQLAAVVFLFGVANLVTGFYFGRTNHARTGGVGGDSSERTR